ncbi:MAG TPA: efflux RND transporter periplasmic adaptor subunit, partial [Holophagaceae bacterium]|nr:efflux RND transporter periplasmic adaptor subunit [Holophagaceae bacterium]
AAQAAGDFVRVATASAAAPERDLVLQGELLPYAQTTLYAKIAGYLDRISVDKGGAVKAGQVLAVLRSPETDSAYQGLEAEAKNKAANFERAKQLHAEKLISLQEFQQAETDARVAQESLSSQAAQKGYQVFRAPFDGVVTARYADPGALFQTGNGAQPLVTVAQIRRLRLDVFVDQRAAASVKTGDAVVVSPEGQAGIQIAARVSRTSGALDPKTRTLLAEIDLDNRDGHLLPGGFASVILHLKVPPRLEIPAEALIIRNGATCVAVVDPQDRVRFVPVALGDEDQQRYPVLRGLQPGQRVALNLGAGAQEGDKVQPVADKP